MTTVIAAAAIASKAQVSKAQYEVPSYKGVLFGRLRVAKRSHASVTCSELSSTINTRSNDRSFKLKSTAGERYESDYMTIMSSSTSAQFAAFPISARTCLEPGKINKQSRTFAMTNTRRGGMARDHRSSIVGVLDYHQSDSLVVFRML